jgi:hypothetical protein
MSDDLVSQMETVWKACIADSARRPNLLLTREPDKQALELAVGLGYVAVRIAMGHFTLGPTSESAK